MKIRIKKGKAYPVLEQDKPYISTGERFPEFFEKIGMNMDYWAHPEEILAENFTLILNNIDNVVRSPYILSKMRKIILN